VTTASVGDQVAAIGFPIGDPITLTHGGVSGLNLNLPPNRGGMHGSRKTPAE
jgi:S1-C subfamily serine protease